MNTQLRKLITFVNLRDCDMSKRLCSLCLSTSYKHIKNNLKKFYSSSSRLTNAEVRKKRNAMFEEEKQRQQAFIKRIEKVTVEYVGEPERCTLQMNKGISTPYNCAMHINEFLMRRSVLALVDGKPWDMHRPLEDDCVLKFMHLHDEDPKICNEAFWRTGSFVLGHILETSFKNKIYVELCRFPAAKVEQGSFIYDADLGLPKWKPTLRELNCLSYEGANLWPQAMDIERLCVDGKVAQTMFEDNRFKSQQIPEIAENSPQSQVTLYRMGEHIDVVKGPLIPNSSFIHRFNITAVHQIISQKYGRLQRVQAIALPKDVELHWWKWNYLSKEAKQLNPSNHATLARDISLATPEHTEGQMIIATD